MRRVCIAGWPVAHSRSPLIHNYWLRRYGIDGEYTRQPVRPEDAEAFFRDLKLHGFVGCNVTVPLKEIAFRAAGRTDPAAKSVGAANTLWLDDGVLCASNTDIYGFIRNLDDQAPGWDRIGLPAAILGAGGAARGVIRGLLDRGIPRIRLANRSRERAEALAASFGVTAMVFDWESRAEMLTGCGLLVNTTSLGMAAHAPLDIDLSRFSYPGVVCDIVYTPLETGLLRRARSAGLHTADGLGMLLQQAVPGFETWFGIRPEITPELKELLIADLGAH